MSNQTVTLSKEIERELRFLDLKKVIKIFVSIGAIFASSLMVALAIAGLPLNGLLIMTLPTFGISMLITGIGIGGLIGGAVTIAVLNYSKKKITPYANIPNEFEALRMDIEMLKGIMIDLGTYVASIDDKTEKARLGSILFDIHKRLKDIEENQIQRPSELDYNRIIAEQKRTIFDLNLRVREIERQLKEKNAKTESEKDIELAKLKGDLRTAISSIATSKEKITELENRIKDLESKK